jgi:hypothetical protein
MTPLRSLVPFEAIPCKPSLIQHQKCYCCGRKAANTKHYLLAWDTGAGSMVFTAQLMAELLAQHQVTTLDDLLDIYPDNLMPKALGSACFQRIQKKHQGKVFKGHFSYLMIG